MNNLAKRKIVPPDELAEFLRVEGPMDPLTFTTVLWNRLYQSGSVKNRDGTRARRRRKRDREAAKRRRH